MMIRNLLMHIWPVKGRGVWQWNVAQVLRRIDQFNGRRIVSVVTDEQTDAFDAVRQAFGGTVKDFLHFRNDPELGETVSFLELLERVNHCDPDHITFYAHAKGVKYRPAEQPMVKPWAAVMYASLLDYPSIVDDALGRHMMVGAFLKRRGFFTEPANAPWHYAGTFFWFRNQAIFGGASWQRIPRTWWGAEAWPGIVCPEEQAGCLVLKDEAPAMTMYKPAYWEQTIRPAWKQWQIEQAPLQRHGSYAETLNALRLLDSRRIVVGGPQRSGTTIAAKMLAQDLGLPYADELIFGTHAFRRFYELIRGVPAFVLQAPAMSPYLHLLDDVDVVWMRPRLPDVLRSQQRIGWQEHGPLHGLPERERYFDHSRQPVAAIKTQAWEQFQRIGIGERAFDVDYESLRAHRLWVDPDERKHFADRQTYA